MNFTGWVLRNLGAGQEARDRHLEALEEGRSHGTAEVEIAALEDLAEYCLETGNLDGAGARLAEADTLLGGDLVFGWRLRLKLKLVSARLALRALLLCNNPTFSPDHVASVAELAVALGRVGYYEMLSPLERLYQHPAAEARAAVMGGVSQINSPRRKPSKPTTVASVPAVK